MDAINKTFRLFGSFKKKKMKHLHRLYSVISTGKSEDDEYDLVVLGGGSGGLSCAIAAKEHGARVVILDYTDPSPHGSTWDIGGTCANVGCIPKKLFHQAALLGEAVKDAQLYGWRGRGESTTPQLDWTALVKSVSNHIKSVNWLTSTTFRDLGIKYVKGKATFLDSHTVSAILEDKSEVRYRGKNILIAVGGRPKYMEIPGADLAITSDDIFSLKRAPGRTAIVGGGYVALEFAGFLNGLHYPVTLMVRGKFLSGLDQEMAEKIVNDLVQRRVSILRECEVLSIIKLPDGKLEVSYLSGKHGAAELFDTVIFAIGRQCSTTALNLAAANINVDPQTEKIICKNEQTNIPHIFAVGDVLHGAPELTPVAVQAGQLLGNRLFGGSIRMMDYSKIPTTVFTPLEYGCVGMSEQHAAEKFGIENIEVYHTYYKPLEFSIPERSADNCYIKVICMLKERNILGIHFLGPNAGEVIQGYAVALKCKVTMEQLIDTVGVHPTLSEELTFLSVTKRSGKTPKPKLCCS